MCVPLGRLLLLALLVAPTLAAKGGAKSMMGRRKNQQGNANTFAGYNGHLGQKQQAEDGRQQQQQREV